MKSPPASGFYASGSAFLALRSAMLKGYFAIQAFCIAILKPGNAIQRACIAIQRPGNAIPGLRIALLSFGNAIQRACSEIQRLRIAILGLCIAIREPGNGIRGLSTAVLGPRIPLRQFDVSEASGNPRVPLAGHREGSQGRERRAAGEERGPWNDSQQDVRAPEGREGVEHRVLAPLQGACVFCCDQGLRASLRFGAGPWLPSCGASGATIMPPPPAPIMPLPPTHNPAAASDAQDRAAPHLRRTDVTSAFSRAKARSTRCRSL